VLADADSIDFHGTAREQSGFPPFGKLTAGFSRK
jgi:hypothetical protein